MIANWKIDFVSFAFPLLTRMILSTYPIVSFSLSKKSLVRNMIKIN